MQSKRCTKCGETKTSEEFWRDRTRSDGLGRQCKKCRRAYQRAYNEAHREERRAYNRAYDEAHREEISAYRRAYHRAYYEANQEEISARTRAYREAHKEERNVQIRKRQTEARKASREVATRNGEPWTAAEDRVALTSEGTELEIAIELGRTIDSVRSRRVRLRRKTVTA